MSKEEKIVVYKATNEIAIDKNAIDNDKRIVIEQSHKEYEKIINNYNELIENQFKVTQICVVNDYYLPITYFNVFYLLELVQKNEFINIEGYNSLNYDIFNHDIKYIVDELIKLNPIFTDLKQLLFELPYLQKYEQLKYNHQVGSFRLIMYEGDFINVKNRVKEVFEWTKEFLKKE